MKPKKCHAREGGHPENKKKDWIPSFACLREALRRR
jgi:hypothetical protein